MENSVSILIPVIDETWSLEETVDIVMRENVENIHEILIVVSGEKTTRQSLESIQKLKLRYGKVIKLLQQKRAFVGGAVRDAFEAVSGEYTLLMASDLETDPYLVKEMIARMDKKDVDVVATSRWIGTGSFTGYTQLKKGLNFIFQRVFGFLYNTHLTDMTFGFRMYKTAILKKIKWQGQNHEIFFETLIKPLRLGARVQEIPAKWVKRPEGISNGRIFYFFKYVYIGLLLRLLPKHYFLEETT